MRLLVRLVASDTRPAAMFEFELLLHSVAGANDPGRPQIRIPFNGQESEVERSISIYL